MNSFSLAAPPVPFKLATLDEAQLVHAARSDPEAFAELYRAYLWPVYRYALAHVGNRQEAEDITSQTFLAALRGIGHYRGESRFSTWLFGIARNKCADYFRQRKSSGRQVAIENADNELAPSPPLEDLVEQSARFEELAGKIRSLPSDQAEALSLRIFGGLGAAEVGQVMGRSEPAVKMLVHRAVRQLQSRLGHWVERDE